MAKSAKEQVWLAEYYKCLNATEAARRAAYKWPDKQGAQKKAKFADEIKLHLQEKTLEAEAVLARLSEQATNDIARFVTVSDGGDLIIDPAAIETYGYLIKSLTETAHGLKVELYDSQSALQLIGKHYGLFTDKIDVKLDRVLANTLDLLEKALEPEEYERILRIIADAGQR